MKKITLFIAIICSLSLFAEQKNGIVYVKAGATGTGASWSDALGDIQSAINLARTENLLRKDVWVAGGDYAINTCISMSDSISVYGGFAGTETETTQRAKVAGGSPWEFVNPTILTAGDTCRIVEASQNFEIATSFDGFTMTNGKGRGKQLNNSGGAAVVRGNMTLQNCIIKNSTTTGNGGGVNTTGGIIRQCWIYDNTSSGGTTGGGGINANPATPLTLIIEDCVINNNSSVVRGGGMNIQGTGMTYCSNNKIYNNRALLPTGWVKKPGGGIYANSGNNVVKNCLIYNNSGASGVYYNGGSLLNNTIVKNVGGLYLAGNTVNAINNIIWGCATDSTGTNATSISGASSTSFTVQNNATYNQVTTANGWVIADNILFSSNVSNGDVTDPAAGTVGSGPKFNHVTRYIGVATTEDELLQLDSVDWSLNIASPCVNVGKSVATITNDITGLARPQGYPVETAISDLGAYELPYYLVVAGEADNANGDIYSALGEKLTENYTYGYARGSKIELLFQPDANYAVEKAIYTASTDGGITFTGEETDITNQIGTDGFWTGSVFSNIKISVIWKSLTALSPISSEKIKFKMNKNEVEITGLNIGETVTAYQTNGMMVYQAAASGNNMHISLSKGIYIIRIADSAKKIIIL